MKKISVILAVMLILALCSQTVMAAVLEVDKDSPELYTDIWQDNPDNNESYPISMAFSETPTRGVDNTEVERFSVSVNVNEGNMVGQLSILNGSAVNNAVFPFKETVKIDSVTWKWNNGGRSYFFLLYTSMDNQNWTEVEITGNASKIKIENTYDADGNQEGPGVECYASVPAGLADNDDVKPITFTFKQTDDAKYFKIVMFGNDAESGDLGVRHQWFSFNSMKFEGSVVVAEAAPPADSAAAEEAAPAAPPVAAPSVPAAPKTGDAGIIALFIITAAAAAGAVAFKKKAVIK
jgi:hypothetical protein